MRSPNIPCFPIRSPLPLVKSEADRKPKQNIAAGLYPSFRRRIISQTCSRAPLNSRTRCIITIIGSRGWNGKLQSRAVQRHSVRKWIRTVWVSRLAVESAGAVKLKTVHKSCSPQALGPFRSAVISRRMLLILSARLTVAPNDDARADCSDKFRLQFAYHLRYSAKSGLPQIARHCDNKISTGRDNTPGRKIARLILLSRKE